MPNEQPSKKPSGPFGSNGQGLPGDPLESAIGYVGGSGRTTGEEPFGVRQQAAIAQYKALVEWGEKSGLNLDPSVWAGRALIGGSEHDIWAEGGEYWKVTRPDRFGWTVLPGNHGVPEIAEATPLEYLERWKNANRVLGDSAKLRGIATTAEGVQVIISQKIIAGSHPDKSAVSREMAKRGFAEVPFSIGSEMDTTFYDDDHRIAAFDASSDNFILREGIPVPIDLIVIRVGEILRRQLLDLIDV